MRPDQIIMALMIKIFNTVIVTTRKYLRIAFEYYESRFFFGLCYTVLQQHFSLMMVNVKTISWTKDRNDIPTRRPNQEPKSEKKSSYE